MIRPRSTHHRAAVLAAALFASLAFSSAADRPLHVLYVGEIVTSQHSGYVMLPGQWLAPEAIYFDHSADPGALTPGYLKHFDAVLLATDESKLAPAQKQALADFAKAGHGVKPYPVTKDDAQFKAAVLEAVGAPARQEWEAFVAAREPRNYEKRGDIANYEKRPEPLPYQFPMSAKGSMSYTQVPADFDLQLFASEPDIFKPIAMAWDERGRLWLAETRDYPNEVRPEGTGNDDIKICEDTDGDGKADKFTIFADKLNIPTSITFANGGVIVAQAPHFLFLKDTNGDGKADVRQELFKNCWGINDTHAGPSSLHYGFDNWFYGTVGYAGFRGSAGSSEAQRFQQGVFRFRADGSAIEFLHQFSNNTWGFGYNDAGDIFGSTANNAPSFFCGIPQTLVPVGTRVMTAKRINTIDKLHPNTANIRQVDVLGGWTAAAGHMFMNSGALPERLRGEALVTEPTAKLISVFKVMRDGAGYRSDDSDNLLASSDEWMSPVAAEVGPDGAVWVADWQNYIIQHNPTPSPERGGYKAETGKGGAHVNPNRDATHGRIYRVVWKDGQPSAIKSLSGAPVADVVKALASDNQFWRLTAQRLLVESGKKDAVPALVAMAKAGEGVGAIHALWTLRGLGALDAQTQNAALLAKDPAVRRNAVRALGTDDAARNLYFSTSLVHDADLTTRLAAFVKLAEFPTSPEIKTLIGRLRSDAVNTKDEWLSDALKMVAKKHSVQAVREGPNLLPNPSFEVTAAGGLPQGWTRRDYGNRAGNEKAKWEVLTGPGDAHSGTHGVRCITYDDGDTSLHADVTLKPNTQYRLSGWIKTHALRGKASFNDNLRHKETDRITAGESGWTEVETIFDSGNDPSASINILHVAKGDSYFDDVKLCELLPETEQKLLTGDPKRGEQIFRSHPLALCAQCHAIGGQGGNVGPALDGIASRKDAAYISESLVEPNAKLAEGFAGQVSPMPPMGLILKDQELADVKAFLLTLKAK
jgi:putative membrane-bound dehydrogenase-like protein